MDVLLDKDQATLAVCFVSSQSSVPRFDQKFSDIVICEVAEYPLDPYSIIFVLIVKVLETPMIVLAG